MASLSWFAAEHEPPSARPCFGCSIAQAKPDSRTTSTSLDRYSVGRLRGPSSWIMPPASRTSLRSGGTWCGTRASIWSLRLGGGLQEGQVFLDAGPCPDSTFVAGLGATEPGGTVPYADWT